MGKWDERHAHITSYANEGPFSVKYNTFDRASGINCEDGALREGRPPKLLSPEVLALHMQYAGIGFVNGVLPALIHPMLQGYLNAERMIVVSAFLLVQLP